MIQLIKNSAKLFLNEMGIAANGQSVEVFNAYVFITFEPGLNILHYVL